MRDDQGCNSNIGDGFDVHTGTVNAITVVVFGSHSIPRAAPAPRDTISDTHTIFCWVNKEASQNTYARGNSQS